MKIRIIVGPITYAIKLRKLLLRAKINAALIKLDNTDDNIGCSHGVIISERDLYTAIVILKQNGINYKIRNDIS